MPPVEGIKALVSHMMTEQTSASGEPLEMIVIDVSRAHFYGVARRRVFTTLPEGREEEGYCALLQRTMYGTEDAAAIWGDTWAEHIAKKDYKVGTSNPSLIYGNDVRGLCHGDDFVMAGGRSSLIAFENHMKEAFQLRRCGHAGFLQKIAAHN